MNPVSRPATNPRLVNSAQLILRIYSQLHPRPAPPPARLRAQLVRGLKALKFKGRR